MTTAATEAVIEKVTPIALAESFLAAYGVGDQGLILRRWRGDWWLYAGRYYQAVPGEIIQSAAYQHIERLSTVARDSTGKIKYNGDGQPKIKPIVPTIQMIRETLAALPSRGLLLSDSADPPRFLDGTNLNPIELLPVRNGVLHLPTEKLLPSTPHFFATSVAGCPYDPSAPQPERWHAFLTDLFGDDAESIRLLQQWYGYCLTPDSRQHKVLLLVGPKRSGKGTIARILTAILGPDAVAGPTLATLAQNFGLSGLLNKTLATISDARLSKRTDQAIVVERLLSISGEDSLMVDRKHREPMTVRLPTRLMLMTNELPRLTDVSGALASRFLILRLTQSFYRREDTTLEAALLAELPAILNWAIAGWRDLKANGRFIEPASSREVVEELEAVSSPITTFLKDRCVVAPDQCIEVGCLFNAWRQWCEEQGWEHTDTRQTFGRDLRAALPSLKTVQHRTDMTVSRFYEGVNLVFA